MELYIALAVPVFFLLIGVELLLNLRTGGSRYTLQDSITNLSCGIGQQLTGLVFRLFTFVAYLQIFEHLALWTIPTDSVLAWVAVLVGADFCYYWFHRAGHRVNFAWASHAVHHQSEEMNLSVALRQSWTQQLVSWMFYLPLALIGFPPEMFLVAGTIMTLYQFWIHTEVVTRTGPLEWVINTPSHHRVHHGVNPKYIDKNYAGMLIIWDRMFGTFVNEQDGPVYGTVKPVSSWNPLWVNVEPWYRIAKLSWLARRWRDKLWAWFAPPEWRPTDLGGTVIIPEVERATQQKYSVTLPRGLSAYVFVQFAAALIGTTLLLAFHEQLPDFAAPVLGGLCLVTLISVGALFETRRWGLVLELVRLVSLGGATAWLTLGLPVLPFALPAVCGISGVWLLGMRSAFATPAQEPVLDVAAAV